MSKLKRNKDVDEILHRNNVHTNLEYYYLVRSLKDVPRGHALPIQNKDSVMVHIMNTLFLFDFCKRQSLISPIMDAGIVSSTKKYLQYHDVEESLIGDLPFYVARKLPQFHEDVREDISLRFGYNPISASGEVRKLAAQIDILDFIISVQNLTATNEFDSDRLKRVYENGLEVAGELHASSTYKVKYDHFIK